MVDAGADVEDQLKSLQTCSGTVPHPPPPLCLPAEEDHDHHLLCHPRRHPGIDHRKHIGLLRPSHLLLLTTSAETTASREKKQTTTQKLETQMQDS